MGISSDLNIFALIETTAYIRSHPLAPDPSMSLGILYGILVFPFISVILMFLLLFIFRSHKQFYISYSHISLGLP
jgi:uncharacterized membrane protein